MAEEPAPKEIARRGYTSLITLKQLGVERFVPIQQPLPFHKRAALQGTGGKTFWGDSGEETRDHWRSAGTHDHLGSH